MSYHERIATSSSKDGVNRDSAWCFQALLLSSDLLMYAMAIETAVESLLHPLVPQTFCMGHFAPCPTTEFSAASWKDGPILTAKRVPVTCFQGLFPAVNNFQLGIDSLVAHTVMDHSPSSLFTPDPTTIGSPHQPRLSE
jgi:hypothetical protein